MKNFFDKFRETEKVSNLSGDKWENLISNFQFIEELIEKFRGSTFNYGLFRIHTKESSEKWTNLLTKEYFKEELGNDQDLFCFGFNWQGIMYCVNERNDEVTYFDPATCCFFKADFSLNKFFDEVLSDDEYDVINEVYFESAKQYLNFKNLEFETSVGHIKYLHLGGIDDIENLEVVNAEVLWDLQIQVAENINEIDNE